ncbi:hypothetical protein B0H16DRAFT_1477254 [Mycena metata]|uniref:F-box domain-containing protein n=1 Tax=Mycena metata TaxID=1033252 RepID=A0AAD7MG22_9AGAR|nr:hypothetical protein B0H16DRAFT_1477254 [Mycena metata]
MPVTTRSQVSTSPVTRSRTRSQTQARPKQLDRPRRSQISVHLRHQSLPSVNERRINGTSKKQKKQRVIGEEKVQGTGPELSNPPIDREVSGLQLERESHAEQLDGSRYPVLTLPNEITSEIFQHTIHPSSDFEYSNPTALTHICRHWRAIALALPALWSNISLRPTYQSLQNNLALAQSWLPRSHPNPLSISIHSGATVGQQGVGKILEIIRPHLDRLQRLELGLSMRTIYDLELLQSPMPKLRCLALWCNRFGREQALIRRENVPSLHTVELHHFFRSGILRVDLPWKHITTLICNRVNYRHWRLLLEETPTLIRCEVTHMQREMLTDAPASLTLHHLETLAFSMYEEGEDPVWEIFPLAEMHLPALRVLRIPEPYLHTPSVDDLQAFVSRSGCQLEELRIIDPLPGRKQAYLNIFPFVSFHRQVTGISPRM